MSPGMLKSEAHVAYLEPFVAGLRLVMNDILKIVRLPLITALPDLIYAPVHLSAHNISYSDL